jgi:hypothetical protein
MAQTFASQNLAHHLRERKRPATVNSNSGRRQGFCSTSECRDVTFLISSHHPPKHEHQRPRSTSSKSPHQFLEKCQYVMLPWITVLSWSPCAHQHLSDLDFQISPQRESFYFGKEACRLSLVCLMGTHTIMIRNEIRTFFSVHRLFFGNVSSALAYALICTQPYLLLQSLKVVLRHESITNELELYCT